MSRSNEILESLSEVLETGLSEEREGTWDEFKKDRDIKTSSAVRKLFKEVDAVCKEGLKVKTWYESVEAVDSLRVSYLKLDKLVTKVYN